MENVVPVQSDTVVRTGTRSRYPRYVFAIFFFISFLNFLDRNILTGASNAIAKDLHLSLAQVGYIASAFLFVYTLATVPLGLWADRAPRKNVVAFCVAIWSIATAFTSLATNFVFIFISRMALGIGEAGYFPAGTALLSDYFHRERRSSVMSLWNVAQYIGIFVGFALGGILGGLGLWRLGFLIAAIPGLIVAFMAWRIREPRRNQADEELQLAGETAAVEPDRVRLSTLPARASIIKQSLQLLRIKSLTALILVQIFAYFVLGVCVTYLPLYLQQKDTFGLSQQATGLYSGGVIVVAGLIGNLLGGYCSNLLERRFGGARILVCGISFMLCAPLIALTLWSRNFIPFTIFFFISVILLSTYNGPSTAATQDIVPSWLRASAVAITLLFAHLLGDAFAPALIGVMATNFDPTHGNHFANNLAGNDIGLAITITCVPALILAGLSGILGARWMKSDVAKAAEAEYSQRMTESE